ncbi:hypothetical protein ACGFXB_25045 [Streptomyces canus]|uniref:hypothetical protein n=1 Tax=Streptomyces canus TaxID=58343 RepID=UPI0037186630
MSDTVDNTTTSTGPTQWSYDQACRALWAHRDNAAVLADALSNIRAWRHLQPHGAADFGPLDAILDALALDDTVPLLQIEQPTSLQEAVAAYRTVMGARRQAAAAARLVWDQIEAAAIREMDRHISRGAA